MARTIAHFWPEMGSWLGLMTDTRDQESIIYSRRFLFWTANMPFLLKLGSRRKLRFELDSPTALANLNALSQSHMQSRAHSDTVEHFLSHVPTGALEAVRRKMIHRLIRMRALDYGRLHGYFLLVLDGTGQLHFPRRHCEHCLERTSKGKTYSYHNVLEAKLVTPDGLALSAASEFIENTDPQASKQDCELKAFGRLAEKIKKQYPQLRLCLVLDALYANGTVFTTCEKNHWKYFITFKQGSMPAVWTEYQSLLKLSRANCKVVQRDKNISQEFAWVEGMEHIDDHKRHHTFNIFQCLEKCRLDHSESYFAWLTNFPIRPDTVADLGNKGGRCRWKIENEGFNTQKNGGFNLEHAYSTKRRQMHNWYILLQISHMILQLVERGSLLSQRAKLSFGSLAAMARRLWESIRNVLIPEEALDIAAAARIQIRLNSS